MHAKMHFKPVRKKRKAPLVPWKKPEGMPRRPLSAYNIFFQEQRKKMLAEGVPAEAHLVFKTDESSPNKKRRRRKSRSNTLGIGFGNLARTIAAQWKALDAASKVPYVAKADEEKDRYNKEMVVWRAAQKEESEKAPPPPPPEDESSYDRKQPPSGMFNQDNNRINNERHMYPNYPDHMQQHSLFPFPPRVGPDSWGSVAATRGNEYRWNRPFHQEDMEQYSSRPSSSASAEIATRSSANITPPLKRTPSHDTPPDRQPTTPIRPSTRSLVGSSGCWSPISLTNAGRFPEPDYHPEYQLDRRHLSSPAKAAVTPSPPAAAAAASRGGGGGGGAPPSPRLRPRSTVSSRGRRYNGSTAFAPTRSPTSPPRYHSLMPTRGSEAPHLSPRPQPSLPMEENHQTPSLPVSPARLRNAYTFEDIDEDIVNPWSSTGERRDGITRVYDTAFDPPSYWEPGDGTASSTQDRWLQGQP